MASGINPSNISSEIIKNAVTIAHIYDIIKKAGLETTKELCPKNKNGLSRGMEGTKYTLPFNTEGVTRYSTDYTVSSKKMIELSNEDYNKYFIEYDANDIVIIGGAALNLYDYVLSGESGFKKRYGLNTLENYIKKKTSDIDIVWWPRTYNKVVITSLSPVIKNFVDKFKENLYKQLAIPENIVKIKKLISETVPQIKNIDTLRISLEFPEAQKYLEHTRPAGAWNIPLQFIIEGLPILKIGDVVIHDNGASQQFDRYGNIVNSIRKANEDVVYCVPIPLETNSIIWLDIDKIDVAVPNLYGFIAQQMFAFDNLIRYKKIETEEQYKNRKAKAFINYKRVYYLRDVISKIDDTKAENKENFKILFATDNISRKYYILEKSHQLVDLSIQKYANQILEACSMYNTSTDKIIKELCGKAELETRRKELEEFRKTAVNNLEKYKPLLNKKAEIIPESLKSHYAEIKAKISKNQDEIISMDLSELVNYQKTMNAFHKLIDKRIKQTNEIVAKASKEIYNKQRAAPVASAAPAAPIAFAASAASIASAAPAAPVAFAAPAAPVASAAPAAPIPTSYYAMPTSTPYISQQPQYFVELAPPYPPPADMTQTYLEKSTKRPMKYSGTYWFYLNTMKTVIPPSSSVAQLKSPYPVSMIKTIIPPSSSVAQLQSPYPVSMAQPVSYQAYSIPPPPLLSQKK